MISVFLIAAIVTLLNSVDTTIRANYGSVRRYSLLTPQLSADVPPAVLAKARTFPGIKSVIVGMPYIAPIKTVFGEMPIPIYGLTSADMPRLVEATGNTLVEGRYPKVNEPEITLSRLWANNFHLKVGQMWHPDSERFPTITEPQKVVGILEGGELLAIADKTYLELTLPSIVQRPSYLFVPTSLEKLGALSARMRALTERPQIYGFKRDDVRYVRVFTFDALVNELRRSLAFLYRFLAIADVLVIGAVALLAGFLANIFFEQRLGEFGLLSALGFRRERLAKRLVIETGTLVLVAWGLGLGLTTLLFELLDLFYMTPNGLIVAKIGLDAFVYTFPIPLIVGVASLATVLSRLYRVDPIEIMERR